MSGTGTTQRGRLLAEQLRLTIVGTEGHDLKCACVSCHSSDAGRIHADTGVYFCYSCQKALNAFDLAKVVLGDHKAAIDAMVAAGLFQDRSGNGKPSSPAIQSTSTNGEAGGKTDADALLTEIAAAKHCTPKGFRTYEAIVKGDRLNFPMRDEKCVVCSLFWMSLKNLKGQNYQNGTDIGKTGKARGVGLFLPGRKPAAGETWVLIEGVKDASVLSDMGYNAAGLPGNTLDLKDRQFPPLFDGVDVVVMPDADKPSWKGAKKTADALQGHAASVKVARLPAEITPSHGRDVRDILASLGDRGPDAIRKAIDGAEPPEQAFAWMKGNEAVTLAPGTRVFAGDRGNVGEIVSDNGATCTVHFCSPERHHAEKEIPKSQLRSLDGRPVGGEPDEPLPPPCSLRKLVSSHPTLRPAVIDGLLRVGETMNLVAAPKAKKSWLVNSLALCVADGGTWLDTFPCVPGRVLIIDAELHPEVIAHRLLAVAEAMGIGSRYLDMIDVLPLRGFGSNLLKLAPFINSVEPGRYAMVILDAWYRFIPPGVSENDNAQVMQLYNTIDGYTSRLKSAWVNVHHVSKGDQSGKNTTDVGSGAGSQSRAADTHLIIRPHEQDDVAVIEAVVRSWPPVERLAIRWTFPTWQLDTEVDPRNLRKPRERSSRESKDIHLDSDRQAIVNAMFAMPGPQTKTFIRDLTRSGNPRFGYAWVSLLSDGTITAVGKIKKGNGQAYESFVLSHKETDE